MLLCDAGIQNADTRCILGRRSQAVQRVFDPFLLPNTIHASKEISGFLCAPELCDSTEEMNRMSDSFPGWLGQAVRFDPENGWPHH